MEKITDWLNKYIEPIAYKLSRNKFVNIVSNTFISILPITLIGSFASLLKGMKIPAWQALIGGTWLQTALGLIVQFTISVQAVYVVAAIAYRTMEKENQQKSALLVACIAIAVFFILVPMASVENKSYIDFNFLGAKGILLAMLSGLVVAEIFTLFYNKHIYFSMPEGVPPMIAESYKALVPGAVVVVLACVLNHFTVDKGGLPQILINLLAAPLAAMSNTVVTKIILNVITQSLWLFGIHGGNVTNAISKTLYTAPTLENIEAYAANETVKNMFTNGFDAVSAAGHPINLAIIILCLLSKKKEFKEFGKLSFLPTLFGITEPIRFGLPIVLNVYFFIPVILTTIVNTLIVYVLMATGLIPLAHSELYSGIPYVFGSIFNIGVVPGILVSILIFVASFVIVYPFFKMYENHGMGTDEAE